MTSIREMLLHIGVLDEATKRLEDLKSSATDLEKQGVVVPIKVQDKASGNLRSISGQLLDVQSKAVSALPALGGVTTSLGAIGRAADSVQSAVSRIPSAIGSVSRGFQTLGTTGYNALQTLSKGWGEVEDGIKKVTALAGGIALGSAYSAIGVQANRDIIKASRPKDAAAWDQYIDEGDTLDYTSSVQRSNLAAGVARYWKGADQKLSQEVLEILEKQAVREGYNPGEISDVVKGVGLGKDKALKSMLPGMSIDYGKIDDEVTRRMSNPIWKRQNAGKSESQVRVDVVMEKIKEWGEKPQEDFGGVSVKDMKVSLDYMNQIKTELQKISETLGKTLLPYVAEFVKGLSKAAELVSMFPDAAAIIALGSGFVFVTGTIAIMIANFVGLMNQLKVGSALMWLAGKAAQGLALGLRAANLAMMLITAHPIIAALVLIGILLVAVAVKTGLAKKAFDAIINSKPAKLMQELLSGKTDFKVGLELLGKAIFPIAVLNVLLKHLPEIWKILTSGATIQEKIGDLTGVLVEIVKDILRLFKPVIDVFTIIKNQFAALGKWVGEFEKWIKVTMSNLPEKIGQRVRFWEGKDASGRSQSEEGAAEGIPGDYYVPGPNESQISPAQWTAMYALKGPEFGKNQVYGPDGTQLGQTVADLMPFDSALRAMYSMRMQGQRLQSVGGGVSLGSKGQTLEELAQTRPWLAPILEGGDQAQVYGAQDDAAANQALKEAGTWGGWGVPGFSWLGQSVAGGVKSLLGASPSMAAGGQITASGVLIGHEGEEVSPARAVEGGETVLERLTQTLHAQQLGPGIIGSIGGGVTVNGPLIQVERIDRAVDVDDLVWRARRALENISQRSTGHYQT